MVVLDGATADAKTYMERREGVAWLSHKILDGEADRLAEEIRLGLEVGPGQIIPATCKFLPRHTSRFRPRLLELDGILRRGMD